MLMIVVFAELGKADSGIALLVERGLVAPAKKAVRTKDQQWLKRLGRQILL